MATAQANAAAPLDQLVVDVGAGPLGRWRPGRPGVEFIASLAAEPRTARMSAALHRDFLTVCGATSRSRPVPPR
jgi:hypothetical protein